MSRRSLRGSAQGRLFASPEKRLRSGWHRGSDRQAARTADRAN